jgi:Asp-tRNA(Asn)/Glu-tRNA(Gln) amidotransferase A subunit family amidase
MTGTTKRLCTLTLAAAITSMLAPALPVDSTPLAPAVAEAKRPPRPKRPTRSRKFHLLETTIPEIHKALKNREISCVELVELYLDRIEAYNGVCVDQPQGKLGFITAKPNAGQLNALMTLNLRPANRALWGFDAEKARSLTDAADDDPNMPDALETAAALDAHLASTGKLWGPLHCVPMAIKDQFDTFDMRTTAGMIAGFADDRPPDDATFVLRLRQAGAIVLAKANMGEMAAGQPRSSFGGVLCNPYDTARNPGHSSGGSATSVAANLVTCSIGEETGGSILHPTKNNNLYGLVPTQETISRDGMIDASMVTRLGPMCRTVEDTARVFDVIVGFDPKDELTAFSVGRLPEKPYYEYTNPKNLNGMRIGVLREYMDPSLWNQADVESIAIQSEAIQTLADAGATLVDPGEGGALLQGLHQRAGAVLPQLALHGAVPRRLPGGREPHQHVARHVVRSVTGPGGNDRAQHRRRDDVGPGHLHADALFARARRPRDPDHHGPRQQVAVLHRHPSAGEFRRPQSRAPLRRRCDDPEPGELLREPLRLSGDRAAVHGEDEPRRAGLVVRHGPAVRARHAARADAQRTRLVGHQHARPAGPADARHARRVHDLRVRSCLRRERAGWDEADRPDSCASARRDHADRAAVLRADALHHRGGVREAEPRAARAAVRLRPVTRRAVSRR